MSWAWLCYFIKPMLRTRLYIQSKIVIKSIKTNINLCYSIWLTSQITMFEDLDFDNWISCFGYCFCLCFYGVASLFTIYKYSLSLLFRRPLYCFDITMKFWISFEQHCRFYTWQDLIRLKMFRMISSEFFLSEKKAMQSVLI